MEGLLGGEADGTLKHISLRPVLVISVANVISFTSLLNMVANDDLLIKTHVIIIIKVVLNISTTVILAVELLDVLYQEIP